ncbi:DHH family phosphoesterase [Candidatus Uhrbacteria bacterium]|nr:DHH family phosphoesterase [Candidatus Uhrbacteria bacterium]
MPMDIHQQIAERLAGSERTLIAFPQVGAHKESGDALGSALALYRYLRGIGKQAEMVSPDFAPGRFAFLPHATEVLPALHTPRRHTVRIKTDRAPIKEWSYGLKEGALEVYLTPEQGTFSKDDVEVEEERYGYDHIVTLDTPDLPALGPLFREHGELFYKTPIINIDHHPENEQYGQINLIDINAGATGEIIAEMLKLIAPRQIDQEIATNLFAAIFLKTGGFKTPSVTPNTLKLAAELITLGARREEIMQNLFRARSLASLKLWGRALAHLKFDPQYKIAWSSLTTREILETGGDLRDLPEVIEELIFTAPEARLVALLYEESAGRVCVLLASRKAATTPSPHALPWEMLETAPGRTKYCVLVPDLIAAEQEVMDKLKGMLRFLPQQ